MKKVIWHPKAKDIISSFPEAVRNELGYLLFRIQKGEVLAMPHSSPMKSVAAGVSELRVRGADGIYRAFYFSKSSAGILIFHAFVKKTPKTPINEIDIGKKRLKELLED
jgi:phage-related protein